MPIKKKLVSWEEFEKIQGGDWTPSPHTHPGSDITSKVSDSDKIDGRKIYVSDDPPSGGNDGDLWFEY